MLMFLRLYALVLAINILFGQATPPDIQDRLRITESRSLVTAERLNELDRRVGAHDALLLSEIERARGLESRMAAFEGGLHVIQIIGGLLTALMGAQEMDVPDGLRRCVRVLIHWNTEKSLDEIKHVYMKGSERLRPDLYPDNKIVLNGESKS